MIAPNFLIILVISNLFILIFFNKIDEFFNIRDYSDGKRKFQKRPVTLLGGSILILNFLIYLFTCTFSNENFTYNFTQQSKEYFSLVFGSILFYLFGLYDDKFKLKPNYKLIVAFILVTVFVLVDNKLIISEINFSFVENKIELKNFSYFFTVLAFLLFMNALNMFDGINLQSGFYCLLIFCVFIYKNIFFNLSLSIIISLILFLYLNFRNKIYLGESGIQFLAFLISYIFIKSTNFQNFTFYADEIFIIMAIPGLDMFRLFIARLISGKHPFKPDTNHIHHLIADYFSKMVAFLTILIFIILSILLYYYFQNKLNYIICYIIGYIIIITYLLKLKKKKLKKITDLSISLILLLLLFIPFLIIGFIIKLESKGPIFYISKRVGQNKKLFNMIKFRTMLVNTPQVNTNDLRDANKFITRVGRVLRKFSIDELPQILNVIIGDMSIVGPRPALINQYDLIRKREDLKINTLKPGITGLAQINGRDKIDLEKKIYYDLKYKNKISFLFDLKILAKTLFVVLKGQDIRH